MDPSHLKKKLSVYVTDKGQLRNVSEELHYEVLCAWELWTGSSIDFYRALGFTSRQMAAFIGKAKKLKREGRFGDMGFKAVTVEELPTASSGQSVGPCGLVEIVWKNGQLIRFSEVAAALDFLKKAS